MNNKTISAAGLLSGLAAGARRCFVFAVLASAISIVFTFLTPQIVRFTVDSVIGTEPSPLPSFLNQALDFLGGRTLLRSNLLFCAGGILICALLAGVFSYVSQTQIARGTEHFTKRLRDRLFAHIQNLPFQWHTDTLTGDIIQRCTSDVELIHNFISKQLIDVVKTLVQLTVAMAMMFSMNKGLALINLAFIPLIVLYSSLFGRRISKQFLKADEAEGELMVAVQENLTGVRVVRAFGREQYERRRFEEKNDIFTGKWIDLGYTLGLFWGVGDFATGAQILTVVCAGAYFSATGQITLGELLAFITYTQSISWPIRTLGRALSDLSKAGVSVKRLREILDAPVEPPQPRALRPDLRGDITFEKVRFAYGGHQVLKDVSFTIRQGSTFGILGATGSGKSTLTYLLNRLYDLPGQSGSIRIGGVDIREIDRRHLRRGIGLVLQESFLFSKTIGENIDITQGGGDLNRMRENASIAQVDRAIADFPQGYDTVVGERGVTLSGGQKQRVAIARMLMQDCPVMVFDDSMSAVDMETDQRIRQALLDNKDDRTLVFISHRISTLMHADTILVLEDGRVAQIGSHEELVRQEGIYKQVYQMQSDPKLTGKGGGLDG